MYEELYKPLPDKRAYLDRIAFEKDSVETAAELNLLLEKHLCSVPFENLSVLGSDSEPQLGIESLFDKIVTKKRGGYCFELNALFCALLRAMNVEIYPILARVVWNKAFLPPYSHRSAIATLEGKRWICDVGYGGPCPVGILCLDTEEVQQVRDAFFRVEIRGGNALVFRKNEGEFKPMLELNLTPAHEVDFIPVNFHIGMNPGSYFRSKTVVSVFTDNGMKCIDGSSFRETTCGELVRNIDIISEKQMSSLLRDEFGIVI